MSPGWIYLLDGPFAGRHWTVRNGARKALGRREGMEYVTYTYAPLDELVMVQGDHEEVEAQAYELVSTSAKPWVLRARDDHPLAYPGGGDAA